MKVSFDLPKSLYDKIVKEGGKEGRLVATEIRFQLEKCYDDDGVQE